MANSYQKTVLPLTEGLDFTTGKLLLAGAESASMQDCLNVELVDGVGYQRIRGVESFSGPLSPSIEDYRELRGTATNADIETDFEADGVNLLYRLGSSKAFGVILEPTDNGGNSAYIRYAVIDAREEPIAGDVVMLLGGQTSVGANPYITVASVKQSGFEAGDTALETAQNIDTYAALLRDRVDPLHNTAAGLHWHRDRLYAVTDDRVMYFEATGGETAVIRPGQEIEASGSGATGIVLYVELLEGTSFAGGNASGMIQYRLTSEDDFEVTDENLTLYEESPTLTDHDLRAYAIGDPLPYYASMHFSRSEQQSIDEVGDLTGMGWNAIDHGWAFNITGGFSSLGDLKKVSRTLDNNFDYESSSEADTISDSAYNGSNVQGSTFAPQSFGSPGTALVSTGYPGWKSSADSSVFATDATLYTAISAASGTTAYANFWYRFQGGTDSRLRAYDKNILGPTASQASPTVSAVTFDSDWYSTQARAPIILRDFSEVVADIPDGSLIVGIKVDLDYSSRHYSEFTVNDNGGSPRVAATSFRDDIIDCVKDSLAFYAGVITLNDPFTATLHGQEQSGAVSIEEDTGDYTTSTTSPGGGARHTLKCGQTAALTGQTTTIGGSDNAFGVDNLSKSFFTNPAAGIAIYGQIVADPVYPDGVFYTGGVNLESIEGQVRVNVDRIKVTFYYTAPSARYYVGNGAGDVCSIDVIYTLTTDGNWETGTAVAEVQGVNLTEVAGSGDPDNKNFIGNGDTLHLTAADAIAGSNSIATVSGNMVYNGLPSLNRINAAKSRYRFKSNNFYAREEWDGFHGVNGVDRAFSFAKFDADGDGDDEYYVSRIVTNTAEQETDHPRHLAVVNNSLALGFRHGLVRISVPGEPENFDGGAGAYETGVGDRLTGLHPLAGDTLAVLCANSIHSIRGNSEEGYSQELISPDSGAIEYSSVDIGELVFADQAGITTLSQSDKYGNFVTGRLSYPITPWVVKRANRADSILSTDNATGIVDAWAVPSRGKVCFSYSDGTILSMTRRSDGSAGFTWSRILIGATGSDQDNLFEDSEYNKYLVPVAVSSQIDDDGKERIHASHYSTKSLIDADDAKYVYEMEVGWGFAGNYIPWYYTLNWWSPNPFGDSVLRKVRLDGLTRGIGETKLSTAADYERDSTTAGVRFTNTTQSLTMPLSAYPRIYPDYVPATRMASSAERGRLIAVKVSGEFNSGLTSGTPTPPELHQVLLLQHKEGKEDA